MSHFIVPEATVLPQGYIDGGTAAVALTLKNGTAAPVASIPVVDWSNFSAWLTGIVTRGGRFVSLFILPPDNTQGKTYRLVALVAEDFASQLHLLSTVVSGGFSSLTPDIPAANIAERIICEEYGLLPAGHPWLKPVRFSRLPEEGGPPIGITDYYRVEGEEVHEVGVGPVHAGVIECGHFRFQCMGEEVIHLEISLGYHHRGLKTLLRNAPDRRTLPLMEVIAGDSTIAHTWSYCSIIEALSQTDVTAHAQRLRSLALELERLANHTGDLGALAGDAGFLPTQAFCGRLRGDWLNTTALLCGNRFGRGIVKPGGVNVELDTNTLSEIRKRVKDTARDVNGAVNLLWNSSSFMSRVSNLGAVSKENAHALGLVGPPARACGIGIDCRIQHPLPQLPEPPLLQRIGHGDVLSRALIRHEEIKQSVSYCLRLLDTFNGKEKQEPLAFTDAALAPEHIAIGLVEGFRGEVCHIGVTDGLGKLAGYTIIDPSIHNWPGLALALRNQEISDFPLCNKSFNLSYCGHDL